MSEQKPLTATIALTCIGAATLRQPDRLHLVFDEPLLQSIAKAWTILGAFNEIGAQLILPLRDTDAFFRHGRPWRPKDGREGAFVVSSLWIHVEAERLHIEVWESYSDDELHGLLEFAELPALRDAAEQHRRRSEDAILHGLRDVQRDADVRAA